MQIRVTRNDINKGEQGKASLCPVARAVRRATGAKTVGTDGYEVTINSKDYIAPKSVSDFVQAFDRDGASAVSPFTFSIPWKKRVVNRKTTTSVSRESRVLVAAKRTK